MVAVARDLTDGGPTELAEVAVIRKSLGHNWRVCVKDAGHGPAIDVREYITADAYPTTDTLPQDAAAKGYHRKTKSDGYVGPTRSGLWMTLEQALAVADALSAAIDAAEALSSNDEPDDRARTEQEVGA